MFMPLQNQLFDIIKLMTQTEKRYFKIYTGKYDRKEKSSYLKLFEAIDKLKKYDEEKIRQRLRNETFISRLAVEKNMLYKLILKSLKDYHSDISGETKVKHFLLEA